jgi:hypothetical protein
MTVGSRRLNNTSRVAGEDFYQEFTSVRDTIISLQYDDEEFLTFHVSQAKHGYMVNPGTYTFSLRCQIGEKIYTFNREHFNQMSNRECNELFDKLGIDGNLSLPN